MARVAVCLSGCGVRDGAEIHESVLTLLALDQAGAEVVCCAPNVEQASVVLGRIDPDRLREQLLGVADPIKETTAEAIEQLHREGLRLVMLTGDNEGTGGDSVGQLVEGRICRRRQGDDPALQRHAHSQ